MKTISSIAAAFMRGIEATPEKIVNAVFDNGTAKSITSTRSDRVSCPMCGGTQGYVVKDPNYTAWSCMQSDCINANAKRPPVVPMAKRQVATLEMLGCPETMRSAHLSKVDISKEASIAIQGLVSSKFQNTLFYGPPGCGKTYLSWAIIEHWIAEKHETARFISWDAMHRGWLDEYMGSGVRNLSVSLSEAPFLVIDDICSREVTEKFLSWVQVILGVRFDNHRPTIYTSNHSPQIVREKVTDPIWSRMACQCVSINGDDRRYP